MSGNKKPTKEEHEEEEEEEEQQQQQQDDAASTTTTQAPVKTFAELNSLFVKKKVQALRALINKFDKNFTGRWFGCQEIGPMDHSALVITLDKGELELVLDDSNEQWLLAVDLLIRYKELVSIYHGKEDGIGSLIAEAGFLYDDIPGLWALLTQYKIGWAAPDCSEGELGLFEPQQHARNEYQMRRAEEARVQAEKNRAVEKALDDRLNDIIKVHRALMWPQLQQQQQQQLDSSHPAAAAPPVKRTKLATTSSSGLEN